MKIEIEISEEDYKAIYNTSLSIDEMYNTLKGRVYCAIVHGARSKSVVPTIPETLKNDHLPNYNYPFTITCEDYPNHISIVPV